MPLSKFEIACLVPPHYDYLASTLIEGLAGLGHRCAGLENSNHVERLSRSKFKHFLKKCNIIIVFQGNSVNCEFLDVSSPAVKVFVDGSDLPSMSEMPKITFDYVFKRELLKIIYNRKSPILYPLQFGVENRYTQPQKTDFQWLASFVGSMSNFQRLAVHEYLNSLNDISIFTGSTGERAYNGSAGLPMSTPKYFGILNNSFASIDIPGLGWDCGRTWEILGSGALLLQFRSELIYSTKLIENEHFIGFSSLEELNEILAKIKNNFDHYNQVRKDGYRFSLTNHSSKARAVYFLDILNTQKSSYVKGTRRLQINLTQRYRNKISQGRTFIADKVRAVGRH